VSAWPHNRSRDGGIDRLLIPAGLGASGAMFMCGKHAIGPDVEAALARVGATTAVCLTEAHELTGRYDAYVEWLSANVPRRAVWSPIGDLHAPSLDIMVALVDELVARLGSGERILIHCAAGMGRTGTTAACVLIELGVEHDEALRIVAASRPMAGPEVGAQRDLVRDFAECFSGR